MDVCSRQIIKKFQKLVWSLIFCSKTIRFFGLNLRILLIRKTMLQSLFWIYFRLPESRPKLTWNTIFTSLNLQFESKFRLKSCFWNFIFTKKPLCVGQISTEPQPIAPRKAVKIFEVFNLSDWLWKFLKTSLEEQNLVQGPQTCLKLF